MSKATDIIVEAGVPAQQQREPTASSSLVSWIMVRVADWEQHRMNNFDARWKEYYRIWRGIFSEEDKTE